MTDLFDIDWGIGPMEPAAPEEPRETAQETKGRRNRSHLKAKVYETSDKFEYRRAFSEVQLLDALGGRSSSKRARPTTSSPPGT